MTPTSKAPVIDKLLESLSGDSRVLAIKTDRCINPPIGCGKPATEFRDELSRKEYRISGLCQACQDSIFG